MGLANFHSQGETKAIDISDSLVTALEILEALEEIGTLLHHHRFIIGLVNHFQRLERNAGAHRIGVERRVRRAGRENLRIDEFLASPHASQRIETVRDGLAKNEDVRVHPEMLDRPEFSGTKEAHLNFVDDEQDTVLVQHFFHLDEENLRRDEVTTSALNGID